MTRRVEVGTSRQHKLLRGDKPPRRDTGAGGTQRLHGTKGHMLPRTFFIEPTSTPGAGASEAVCLSAQLPADTLGWIEVLCLHNKRCCCHAAAAYYCWKMAATGASEALFMPAHKLFSWRPTPVQQPKQNTRARPTRPHSECCSDACSSSFMHGRTRGPAHTRRTAAVSTQAVQDRTDRREPGLTKG